MQEIIIDGQAVPVNYGIRVIQEVSAKNDKTLGETLSDEPMGSMSVIVEATALALNEGARRTGIQKRYTPNDVYDLIDDDPTGNVLVQIIERFSEAVRLNAEKFGVLGKHLGEKRRRTKTPPPAK